MLEILMIVLLLANVIFDIVLHNFSGWAGWMLATLFYMLYLGKTL